MAFSTPFFPLLGPLLFGRAPRPSLAQYASQLPKVESISALREAFASLCPDSLFSRPPKSRQRLFTPVLTFWTFLSQVLCPGSSCRDAVRKAQSWWAVHLRIKISASTSAYCQARLRLLQPQLERIHRHVCHRMEANAPSQRLWRGRSVKVVDGTGLSMPDTPANQKLYPQSTSQRPGCGFPLMKLLGIFSLSSGALLHFDQDSHYVHESQIFVKLWPHFSKGDIVLADRAFSSFLALGSLLAQGVDSLMRLHGRRKVDFRKGKSLGHNDQLVLWRRPSPSAVDHHHDKLALLPMTILLRQIAFQVQIKGFRTRRIILVTTLLDPVAFPAEALCQLYFQRWSVETHFRELKTLLALDVLRCETPAMIRKELLVHVIAYNLVRSVMQTAAILHHVNLDRVSFKGALDTLIRFADAIQAAHQRPRRQAPKFRGPVLSEP
jgi:Transposase DDE domain